MSRYEKGARYERKARDELQEDGWFVMRSAGSKGGCDLIAVKIRFIEVKSVEEPKSWTPELEKLAKDVPNGPGMSRELWVWNKGCGWEKHTVEDTR